MLTNYETKWHKIMELYLDLTVLVGKATEVLFPSKQSTKTIVRTEEYVGWVEHFSGMLSTWERGSEELNKHTDVQGGDVEELEAEGVLIPKPFWNVLRIEFCYAKIFVYCISLEAVGERRKRLQMKEGREMGKGKDVGKAVKEKDPLSGAGPGVLGGSFFDSVFGEEEVDWEFIQIAFRSGLEILRIVTADGEVASSAGQTNPTAPSAIPWLRFAPVRVYVRIIFAAIFLLKATALLLSLGPGIAPQTARTAIQEQSKECLRLLSRTIKALKGCAVDGAHLANTFADLLGKHIDVLKWRVYPRRGGRGGHAVHERGGRGGGAVGARGVPAVVGLSTPAPSGANTTTTPKLETEKEIQVVFPPTPVGMYDNDHHEDPRSGESSITTNNIPLESTNLEPYQTPRSTNTPTTSSAALSMPSSSSSNPSTSPHPFSQLPVSNSSPAIIAATATLAGQTPAYTPPFPTTLANTMCAFTTGDASLGLTGTSSTLLADSVNVASLSVQQETSGAEWELLDDILSMGDGGGIAGGEYWNIAGGVMDETMDLGVYGMGGTGDEEEGAMNELLSSMGGGGLNFLPS